MNIFYSLEHDHHIQRQLAEQLVATSGDSEQRRKVFAQLKAELVAHADAEERYFYVPLINLDATQGDARHGIAEHHEIDELVAQLEKTDCSSPAWLKYAKDLAHKVKHHLHEEEQDYFPVAQEVLSEDRSNQLGKEYLAYMHDDRNNRQ